MSFDTEAILHCERLTRHFGGWPSFHDAEVIDIHLWRGQMAPGDWDDSNMMPVATVTIRVLRATQGVGQGPDVLTVLRFHDVDAIHLDDFNHDNMIVSLTLTTEDRGHFTSGEPLPPYRVVTFDRGFGLSARLRCLSIEVVSAEPVAPGPLPGPPYPRPQSP
jgi:hypothetical protein